MYVLITCSVLLILLIKYLVHHRNFYILSWKLPGPLALPLIGNSLAFFCNNEDIFQRAVNIISNYPSPMRFWLGHKLTIIFSEPEQASKILSSSNFSDKGEVYRFMKDFDGDGLISGSGPKWKNDRKLMAPLFGKKSVQVYFSVIVHHTNILLEKLEPCTQKGTCNVVKYLHRCTADFVNETIIGEKTDAQNGHFDDFLLAIDRVYDLVHARMVKVWLQIDWIFKMTHFYHQQTQAKNTIHGFLKNVVRINEEKRITKTQLSGTILDNILNIKNQHPNFALGDDLIHHLSTLYSASEDTITTISAFTLLLLGMYPDVQERVVDEIRCVVGDKHDPEIGDLSNLPYLDMCIKDVLRLFPIAPFLMRTTRENFQIDQFVIPKGCSVVVSIHNIHRSSKHWERSDDFYPEHFLPEAVKKRHVHAYLPFSAGPRGCVGKSYAYMALKIMLILILKKYVIYAEGKVGDIELKTDITVRPKGRQFPIKIDFRK
ncbi:cytochrome P450 4g15-like [Zophobas morio]|uniref:cytochrome P450 4g15-like n=1 Tax=Zophobas morio TaxID=2755281 RepID=UPI003082C27A